MHWTYYIILIALMLAGLFLNILGLPGLWLMVISYVGYAFLTGWDVYVGWPSVLAVVVLALGAELVEFLAGAAGSAAAGGRKRGMAGAIIGGIVGGIVGTGVIPIPIVGTIIGACAGAFVGAFALEYADKDADHAMRVGIGAAKGRFWGIVWKSLFGIAMFLVAGLSGLPMGDGIKITGTGPATPPPTTPTTQVTPLPTTAPTTLPLDPVSPTTDPDLAAPTTAPAPAAGPATP